MDEGGLLHEDSEERLREIQEKAMGGLPGIVLRMNPDTKKKKKQHLDGEFKYCSTKHFDAKMQQVAGWIKANVVNKSDCNMDKKEAIQVHKLFFN